MGFIWGLKLQKLLKCSEQQGTVMFKIVNVYQRKLNLLNSREWAIKLVSNNKNTKKVPIYRYFLHIRLYQGLIRDLKILDIIKNQ